MTNDPKTSRDAVVASPVPSDWAAFFALVQSLDVPADFMAERPMNVAPRDRILFDEAD